MRRFVLRLAPKAVADVDSIVSWLAPRSEAGAEAWLRALDEAKERIVEAPESFPEAREARRLRRGLREAIFRTRHGNPYRLIYVIDGEEIVVLRVRGPGQPYLRASDM